MIAMKLIFMFPQVALVNWIKHSALYIPFCKECRKKSKKVYGIGGAKKDPFIFGNELRE